MKQRSLGFGPENGAASAEDSSATGCRKTVARSELDGSIHWHHFSGAATISEDAALRLLADELPAIPDDAEKSR